MYLPMNTYGSRQGINANLHPRARRWQPGAATGHGQPRAARTGHGQPRQHTRGLLDGSDLPRISFVYLHLHGWGKLPALGRLGTARCRVGSIRERRRRGSCACPQVGGAAPGPGPVQRRAPGRRLGRGALQSERGHGDVVTAARHQRLREGLGGA